VSWAANRFAYCSQLPAGFLIFLTQESFREKGILSYPYGLWPPVTVAGGPYTVGKQWFFVVQVFLYLMQAVLVALVPLADLFGIPVEKKIKKENKIKSLGLNSKFKQVFSEISMRLKPDCISLKKLAL